MKDNFLKDYMLVYTEKENVEKFTTNIIIRGFHDPARLDNPSRLKGYWVGFEFGILTLCIFQDGFGSYFELARLGSKSHDSLEIIFLTTLVINYDIFILQLICFT